MINKEILLFNCYVLRIFLSVFPYLGLVPPTIRLHLDYSIRFTLTSYTSYSFPMFSVNSTLVSRTE